MSLKGERTVVELPVGGLAERNENRSPNDDEAVDSYSSLLSEDHSADFSSDEEESVDSDGTDDELQHLQEKFVERDKLLKKISKEISPEYAQVLRESEDLVRAQTFRLLKRKQLRLTQRQDDTKDDGSANEAGIEIPSSDQAPVKMEKLQEGEPAAPDTCTSSDSASSKEKKDTPETTDETPIKKNPSEANGQSVNKGGSSVSDTKPQTDASGLFEMIRRDIVFEYKHSLKGYVAMVLFCGSHMCIYELLSLLISESTRNVANQSKVNACVLILGLFFSRLSGALWGYVGKDTYRCVKFDMHNRIRLGHWDARILRWVRRHPRIRIILGILGIYFCFIPVVDVHYRMLKIADNRQQILDGLPSTAHGISTAVQQVLSYGMQNYGRSTGAAESTCAAGGEECAESDWLQDLSTQDEAYAWSKLTVSSYMELMGYSGAAAVSALSTFWFYGVLIAIYIRLLTKLDFHYEV